MCDESFLNRDAIFFPQTQSRGHLSARLSLVRNDQHGTKSGYLSWSHLSISKISCTCSHPKAMRTPVSKDNNVIDNNSVNIQVVTLKVI